MFYEIKLNYECYCIDLNKITYINIYEDEEEKTHLVIIFDNYDFNIIINEGNDSEQDIVYEYNKLKNLLINKNIEKENNND